MTRDTLRKYVVTCPSCQAQTKTICRHLTPRSNIEVTSHLRNETMFSVIKRMFGSELLSKNPTMVKKEGAVQRTCPQLPQNVFDV